MNQLKRNKGITLVALVVTIIVLLILAGVTIALVLGQNGIFGKAQVAAESTNSSQELEQVRLAVLEARTNSLTDKKNLKDEIEKSIKKVYPEATVVENEVEGKKEYTVTLKNGNIYTVKENGNVTKKDSETPPTPGGEPIVDTVTIPEGFTHKEGNKREEGIVVADKEGNEYVWVPVTQDEEGNPTEPYIESNGILNTSKGEVKIQLQRSDFGNGNSLISMRGRADDYKEETKEDASANNAIADDITAFKASVRKKGGYFIGRYEAGLAEEKLVLKAGQKVWDNVTQTKASELCRNIDTEKGYTGVTSDLVNSYAWDTAIVFIQACGTDKYSAQVGLSKITSNPAKTGETMLAQGLGKDKLDKQCNIYDMAGNCYEWSTETHISAHGPSVYRGGCYSNSNHTTSYRFKYSSDEEESSPTFRPILYWNS